MVKISIEYAGDLHCTATHGPSGKKLETDAPVDNNGKGESFSPTDLTATSLGACMMTVMGIVAQRHQIDLKGTTLEVTKEMTKEPPRRIAILTVVFRIPLPETFEKRSLLEQAALTCPVHLSLHPEVQKVVRFHWVGK